MIIVNKKISYFSIYCFLFQRKGVKIQKLPITAMDLNKKFLQKQENMANGENSTSFVNAYDISVELTTNLCRSRIQQEDYFLQMKPLSLSLTAKPYIGQMILINSEFELDSQTPLSTRNSVLEKEIVNTSDTPLSNDVIILTAPPNHNTHVCSYQTPTDHMS